MKLALMSNILEHPGFFDFITDAHTQEPDLCFLVCGDLLNIFPEPGENLIGSIFCDLYGDWIVKEMEAIITAHFKQLATSRFIQPLKDMFIPNGKNFQAARAIAQARYRVFFEKLASALAHHDLYYIPGNMDYPDLGLLATAPFTHIHQVDQTIISLGEYTLGTLGGIPNRAHPFTNLVEISPYEMAAAEYERRLWGLSGVDVLVTHLSPKEYPPLLDFLRQTPLKALICRAPFDFRKSSDFRGKMEIDWDTPNNKPIFKIRPFDYPVNHALVIDLDASNAFQNSSSIHVMEWSDKSCVISR